MGKFELGSVYMTSGVNEKVAENEQFAKDVMSSMQRYQVCDFSDMQYQDDVEMNKRAIESGEDRIFATYETSEGKIYIITEWDRSATTILFPSEY